MPIQVRAIIVRLRLSDTTNAADVADDIADSLRADGFDVMDAHPWAAPVSDPPPADLGLPLGPLDQSQKFLQ